MTHNQRNARVVWGLVVSYFLFVEGGANRADAELFQVADWALRIVTPPAQISNELGGIEQPGSLSLLVTPQGDTLFESDRRSGLLELRGGDQCVIQSVVVESDSDEVVVTSRFNAGGSDEPLVFEMKTTYTPTLHELYVTALLSCVVPGKLEEGLWFEVPCTDPGQMVFNSTVGVSDPPALWSRQPQKLPSQSAISLPTGSKRIRVNLRHPLIPVPVRTNKSLRLEILCADPPCTIYSNETRPICSLLEPGDTIRAEFGLTSHKIDNRKSEVLSFSPHPYSAEQSLYFAIDDIPTPEMKWAALGQPDNPHSPFITTYLRQLDRFPDVKLTWLLLTDNIQQMSEWDFSGWVPPILGVYPDSTESFAGNISCRLHLPTPTNGSAVLSYYFPVEPCSLYMLRGMYKAGNANEETAFSAFAGSWPSARCLNATGIDQTPGEWRSFRLGFRADTSGVAYCLIRLQGKSGDIYLDSVSCIESFSGRELFPNNSFELYQPFPIRIGADSAWYDVSGVVSLEKDFSLEVALWLQQIQNSSPDLQYSSQLGLGLHGMHHTPDIHFAEANHSLHEFNYYDPKGDSVRMSRIVRGVTAIGLDPYKAISFFRFPGHRHTESSLTPTIKAGVRVIDAGMDIVNYRFGRIIRDHKVLWQTCSSSWHDEYNQAHRENLRSTLDMGMFSLMGAHFHNFGSPVNAGAFDHAIELFDWIEARYPYLIWLKGEQLADFWDELDQIHSIRQRSEDNLVALEWEGASMLGETIYYEQSDSSDGIQLVTVDETPVGVEIRGSRVFVTLPELPVGHHELKIYRSIESVAFQSTQEWEVIVGSDGVVTLGRYRLNASTIRYTIYDGMGRRVSSSVSANLMNGNQSIRFRVPLAPSGVYFLLLEENGMKDVIRIPRVK